MKEIRNPEQLQRLLASLRRTGKTIGFVPTMGALHEGHLSLVRRSRGENDRTVISIFVNPAQFGPREDFRKYPRPAGRDRRLLQKVGADYLFRPSAEAMYPHGREMSVDVGKLSGILCGRYRPGHFQGVATVCAKLFNLVGPCRAYFGAKDYQQTVVIRRLIEDFHFDIALRVLPTVREKDGLAMSSRNAYLSPEERTRARGISQTLFWVRGRILSGDRDLKSLRRRALVRLRRYAGRIDYLEMADPVGLEPLARFRPGMVVLTACFIGKTRLIDNVIIPPHFSPNKRSS